VRVIRADLHLHTCLSPCGDIRMLPGAIVRKAKSMGLDMIAICDHNSGENAASTIKAGKREGVSVLPGIEISSREEVHILGLFEGVEELESVQRQVYEKLPGENDEAAFGPQFVADENDEIVAYSEKLLIGATTLEIGEVIELIHGARGLAVASHIDREGFSIIGQLGFIPPGIRLDAVEVSPRASIKDYEGEFTVITSSDAHYLEDIGKSSTRFLVEDSSFCELRMAILAREGRKAIVE